MARVLLRAPLSEIAGGREFVLEGGTVLGVLTELERTRPALTGWVLDERRSIREHVNIYVNGHLAEAEAAVEADDRVHVLPAITGG